MAIVLLGAAAASTGQTGPTSKNKPMEFLVQDSVKLAKGEMVIVTSGATTKKEVGNCRPGAAPAQNMIVMLENGSGTARRVTGGFVSLGDLAGLGTRIVNIAIGEACGPGYHKVRGTIQ